jgi:hypothetical protein
LYAEWLKIERELLRERALWGEDEECLLNKCKIDFTEGPCRQRKRLLPNTDEFFRNYPYRPELESLKPNKKYKIPSSIDGKDYVKRFQVKSLLHYGQYWQEYVQTQLEFQQQAIDLSNNGESSTPTITGNELGETMSSEINSQAQAIDSVMALKRNIKHQIREVCI